MPHRIKYLQNQTNELKTEKRSLREQHQEEINEMKKMFEDFYFGFTIHTSGVNIFVNSRSSELYKPK